MRPEPVSKAPQRARAKRLAAAIVAWYEDHQRDLPWRRTRDPYAIWISEVMLQQTRVEAVVGRYERFLARFPDLRTLAASPVGDLLAEWAGLGYYRRARNLHAAARRIVEDHGAELPRTAAALSLLPGFGRYTAGAVASIAFEEAVSAVDGNVERVLARYLALDEDPSKGSGAKTVRAWAQTMVESERPSVFNQALMELGATLCTPKAPRCADCPWLRGCAARRNGEATAYPRRPRREPSVEVTSYAAVQRSGEGLLFRRRAEGGLNAGLWELPTTDWHGGAPDDTEARGRLTGLAEGLGLQWSVGEALAAVNHSITKHRVRLVAYRVDGVTLSREELRWGSPAEAEEWGLTAATRKLLRKLPTLV